MGGPSKVFKKLVKTAEEKNILKKVEQPKVKSQMDNSDVKSDLINADKISPTTAEIDQDIISLFNKKKERKKTILTSVTGVNEYPTLSNTSLLGG